MTNNKFSRYINLGAGGEQRAERVQQIRRQASNFNKRAMQDNQKFANYLQDFLSNTKKIMTLWAGEQPDESIIGRTG